MQECINFPAGGNANAAIPLPAVNTCACRGAPPAPWTCVWQQERAGANPLVARVLTLALCRAGTGDTCAIWIVGGFAASQGSGREQEDCRTARARRLRRGDMNWSHCFRPSSLTGSIQIVISRTGCCVAQQLRPVHKGCCGEHASTRLLGKGCCAERVATPPLPRVAARERVAARSAYQPRQPSPRG